MKLKVIIFSLLCSNALAQVGIGTTNPNAALEIQSTSDAIPVLELNPQTAPVGTATGQLSVIDDKLYLYDATRTKWLSVESSTFNFGKEGYQEDEYLEYAGDITANGPQLPANGTLVYATFNSSAGVPNHTGAIEIIDTSTTPDTVISSTPIQLSGGNIVYDNLNVDFNTNHIIRVYIDPDTTGVENPTVVLWVKWRK